MIDKPRSGADFFFYTEGRIFFFLKHNLWTQGSFIGSVSIWGRSRQKRCACTFAVCSSEVKHSTSKYPQTNSCKNNAAFPQLFCTLQGETSSIGCKHRAAACCTRPSTGSGNSRFKRIVRPLDTWNLSPMKLKSTLYKAICVNENQFPLHRYVQVIRKKKKV